MDHSAELTALFESQEAPRPQRKPRAVPPLSQQTSERPSSHQPESGPPEHMEPDDRKRLEELFGPPRQKGETRRRQPIQDPENWPEHNFRPGLEPTRRAYTRRPRPDPRSETTLWDIDQLLQDTDTTTQTPEPPPRTEPERPPVPWPTPKQPPADPTQWLESLAPAEKQTTTTEARLVGTLRGEPTPLLEPLIDTTETLIAKKVPQTQTLPRVHPPIRLKQAPQQPQGALRRLRPLILKIAGITLGLKVGITAGFFLATLL